MATDEEYEQKHATWREARTALTEATAKERHSVFPEVNAARKTEQQAVREEIKAAKQAEETARKALHLPWES